MKLRPMTMDDADLLLEMKNYPETRKFSISTPNEIKKEDHYKWLEKNIQYFQAIVTEEKMVGAIRIQDYEISIWVHRDLWDNGIATYILQHVSKRGMTAKIVEGNIGSMRAFQRAGFEPSSYIVPNRETEWSEITPGYYIFKKY